MITDQMRINILSAAMDERRAQGETIFLRQYLNETFPQYSNDNPDFRLEQYYLDMGLDYFNTTVSQLVELANRDPLYGFLFTETILPALHEALYADADYRNLLAYSRSINSSVVTQPYVKPYLKDTRKKEKSLAVGETGDTHKIDISAKFTTPETFGDTIEIPYETIADCRLPVLSYFLQLYVLNTNSSKLYVCVKILIEGDKSTDVKTKVEINNSANIVGVKDTGAGFTFSDIKTPCLRMARLRFPANLLIAPEDIVNDVSEMEEFKRPYDGKPIHSFKISGGNIIPTDGVICDEIGANRLLLLCQKAALAEYVKQGLMLEREKYITKRMVAIAFHERLCHLKLMRQAAIVVDRSLLFSANGFASYMEPTKPL